ncbi:hypothetical protein HMN09_00141900 [Mycena chlorophos]|uniref:Uncharacterized protein n=1 Tax=Mycena chlorophos TaxID=658473 RepID=A0A8H6TPT6_MYCCL|nr:hypothetical protein HMN09_00141900 [Mycena chlorophos]
MFHRAKNTAITGGTFIVNNYSSVNNTFASEPEEDYRRIRLGDINILKLVSEVELIEDRVIRRRKRRGRENTVKVVVGLQKAYHAKIFGSPDIFTVVAYEGDLSQWHRKSAPDIIWDPILVQLFGESRHFAKVCAELVPAMLVMMNAPTYLMKEIVRYILGEQLLDAQLYLKQKFAISFDAKELDGWFNVKEEKLLLELHSQNLPHMDFDVIVRSQSILHYCSISFN